MQFTLFSADCIGKAANCSYPHKVLVDDAMTMEGAVAHDHVCATYQNNYRNNGHTYRNKFFEIMTNHLLTNHPNSPPHYSFFVLPSVEQLLSIKQNNQVS